MGEHLCGLILCIALGVAEMHTRCERGGTMQRFSIGIATTMVDILMLSCLVEKGDDVR